MQPRRHAHEARGAVGLALFTGRFVLRRIPRIGDLLPRSIERNRQIIALRRNELPVAPIFSDQGNPITRDVDSGRGSGEAGGAGGPPRPSGPDALMAGGAIIINKVVIKLIRTVINFFILII